jgi:hypothetical protein
MTTKEETQTQNPFMTPLFTLGQIMATPGAVEAIEAEGSGIGVRSLLDRHSFGDWGDLSEADKQENELSLTEGFRIFSAYFLPNSGVKIWVITEADRSATTLLLPKEY